MPCGGCNFFKVQVNYSGPVLDIFILKLLYGQSGRLISVEDIRNYLSHIIYILIFYFFLNFLLFDRLQTPTS